MGEWSDSVHPVRKPPAPLLRKALGQHHLVNGAVCRPLVDFLAQELKQPLK